MAIEGDVNELRDIWDHEYLAEYDNQWIAYRNREILASAPHISELLEQFPAQLSREEKPILAFVQMGIMQ